MQKIIIPGGSGFLGEYLADFFVNKGFEVVILSRSKRKNRAGVRYVLWDGATLGEWAQEIEGGYAVINMAGRTVNCRYTPENKRQILESRTHSTQILGKAIQKCMNPPKVWMNSSSATYYKDTRGESPANDEYTGQTGQDFSMGVCQAWEKTFNACAVPQTRKLVLRTSIVLGTDGGVLGHLNWLAKFWLGGTQASGGQFVSWIHLADFAAIIWLLLEQKEATGVFNLAAPNPVTNTVFMRAVRKAQNRSWGVWMPVWMLRLGAVFIKTEAELVLKSRKVVSKRLEELGYSFKYTDIYKAVAAD